MKVWRAREGEGKEDEEAWDLLPCLPFDFYQTRQNQIIYALKVNNVFYKKNKKIKKEEKVLLYIRNENRACALRLAF
jgi:hypothetical protein